MLRDPARMIGMGLTNPELYGSVTERECAGLLNQSRVMHAKVRVLALPPCCRVDNGSQVASEATACRFESYLCIQLPPNERMDAPRSSNPANVGSSPTRGTIFESA